MPSIARRGVDGVRPRFTRQPRRLAALLVLVALVAASWSAAGPAAADDGYEPASQVVADVRGYAAETEKGYDHVLRWMRVLKTFDVLADVTAAEAQGYADRGWERWGPVAAELQRLENADSGYEPDAQLVTDVRAYAAETEKGYDHVLRWMRVLISFGALADVTVAEARGYADQGWARWIPVAAELALLAASTADADPDADADTAGRTRRLPARCRTRCKDRPTAPSWSATLARQAEAVLTMSAYDAAQTFTTGSNATDADDQDRS